jgi:hypothetical protein
LSDKISSDGNSFCRIGKESCSFCRLKYDLYKLFVLLLGDEYSIDDEEDHRWSTSDVNVGESSSG